MFFVLFPQVEIKTLQKREKREREKRILPPLAYLRLLIEHFSIVSREIFNFYLMCNSNSEARYSITWLAGLELGADAPFPNATICAMRLITHDCYSRVVFLWPSPANLYHYFFSISCSTQRLHTTLMLHVEGASRYTPVGMHEGNWNFNLICFASVKRRIFIIVVTLKDIIARIWNIVCIPYIEWLNECGKL